MTRLLVTADAVGGVWTYALDLARWLAPLGIEPVLAVMGPSPSPEQRAAAAAAGVALHDTDLPLDWLAADRAEIAAAAAGIADLARTIDADLIQLNAPALAALARWPAPVVAVAHSCVATWWAAVEGTALPADFAWRSALVADGLRTADAAVAPTTAFAEALRSTYALPAAPLAIHNGRTPAPPAFAGAAADCAVAVGRLWDRAKDVATLDAAAALTALPVHAIGALAGPNGEHVDLHHARAQGTLSDADLAARLAAKPIFVSTARYEPFGLAVLEAAQAGCALVLSDIATFRELWADTALFVPPGDARAFSGAIDRLAADPALRARHGQAALAAARRYTPDRTAAAMAALYRTLVPALGAAA